MYYLQIVYISYNKCKFMLNFIEKNVKKKIIFTLMYILMDG